VISGLGLGGLQVHLCYKENFFLGASGQLHSGVRRAAMLGTVGLEYSKIHSRHVVTPHHTNVWMLNKTSQ
jgi:hypothetical protein